MRGRVDPVPGTGGLLNVALTEACCCCCCCWRAAAASGAAFEGPAPEPIVVRERWRGFGLCFGFGTGRGGGVIGLSSAAVAPLKNPNMIAVHFVCSVAGLVSVRGDDYDISHGLGFFLNVHFPFPNFFPFFLTFLNFNWAMPPERDKGQVSRFSIVLRWRAPRKQNGERLSV